MHPGSPTQTWSAAADKTAPIDRHSLSDGGLEKIYKDSKELAVAPGASTRASRTFNAKDAGTTPGGAIDALNGTPPGVAGNDIAVKGFTIKQSVGSSGFTKYAEQYSTNVLKLDTRKYAPGGRL